MKEELKHISREQREQRLAKENVLEQLSREIPYDELPIRNVEGRAEISRLKDLPLKEQIEGVRNIPSYLISGPGVDNSEINAALEYLGSPIRAIFQHGCSTPIRVPSDWGWYHIDRAERTYENPNPVTACKMPQTSTDAIAYLLRQDT